ncbi:collagen alpha-3(VI) chain-like [Polymixia lowei]
MRDFVQRVVERLDVDENKDRVSVVQYSRDPTVQFYLNTYTTKSEVLDTVRGLRHKGGRPLNTGAALQYLRDNVFTASAGSRRLEGVPQLLIVLSGGRSSDSVDTPASELKELGVLTFAIGTRGSDSRELEKISHERSHALSVSDFTDLPTVQEQLQSSMEAVVIDVTPESPTVIVDHDIARKDVVFLLDGSDGTRNGFPAMRDFVQRVVEKFNVGENKDRVSVVQYSRDAEVHFNLNTYTTKQDVLDRVRGLRHKGGRPLNTGAALQYVRDNVFTASSGSRRQEGIPQILILLSGGRSNDNVDTPASALKEDGVFIVGIGTRNSSAEVQKIATDPSHAQSVSDFSDLPNVQQPFIASLGRVLVGVTTITPTVIVDQKTAGRDVVFLLDGSDGTRSGFPSMIDFVQRVVERLDVGANKDRVSLVQYGRDAEAHFNLNTYTTKQDVIDRVRGLRHKGGRPLNTGAALQYVRDNVFTPSSGSRRLEGVPQMLILLNGGRSFDNVDTPASALKELGVFVFGIGTKRSDSAELQRISYDPNYAFSVSEFNDLPNVQEQLSSAMSTVVVRATPMTPTVIVEPRRPRRDVVFLLDGSDGTRSGFASMRDFVQRVVERLDVDENKDRVSVVQYSRDPTVQFYLNTYTTKSEVLDTVRGLRHKGGRPLNTGAALQYLRDNVFTASAGSRRLEGVPQLLIVLSGGRSSDSVDTPASELKELGVLTFAIGTRGSDSRELEKISHERSHALSVSDFTDLPTVQEQLQSSMEAVVIDVTPESPTVIVDHDIARKDVVFLLDGSDGTRNGFPAMRDFVQRVVEKFNVGENKDRVSVVQYSRDAEVHFNLNTYTTKQDVLDRVRGLRHKGGRPLNTGAALQYVRDNVFTVSSGSRRQEGIPQILILLSGGRSNDNVDTPASALKEDGVFIVGIGTRDSSAEVQKIATDPSHAQSVSDFSDLPNVQQPFIASLGRVLVGVTTITPTVIVDQKTAGRDVVFLLDGSDGTRSGFPSMIDFVQRVVERLDVGANKDRVSLVQYGRDAEAHFNLNTYTTKQDVIDRVRGLRHKGGRPLNTGAALQYVRDNVFTPSSGSRRLEGVPQMLILLNGGRSFDNVDTPASALKELGVFVFGIGTKRSDSAELQRISYDPNYAFSVSEFNDLPNVQEQLSSAMSTVVVRATPMTPTVIDFLVERRRPRRDVVFLLDGSDGTRSGFASMRDFVQRVVERLDVDENKDRVSVVQYSRDPTVQFYLNTYTTKSEVLDTVRGLRHKGGRPLNTGAALQYLRDNVFTASAGSRRLEGVPQLLIVLSGGRSSDSVDTPASELKELGVLTFAIGTRGSDSRELEKISHERSHALSVSDFTDLPTVQEQLQSSMEAVVIDVTPESPTVIVDHDIARKDVVFLLDGSDGTRNGFPAMRDFVQRVVEKFNVGENKDRVSVVQYSRDAEVHFNLNTYTTKQDVLDRVRGLRHRGGRPLNTGAALQYVRDNVFTVSSGSRRQEGIPQILILLSGGRSNDNVDTPASALKEDGVFIVGIGTRDSSAEVQKIATDPSHAQSVSDFSDLPNVQQPFIASLGRVLVGVTTITPTVIVDQKTAGRDVVFLLDGSDGTRSGFPSMIDFVQRVVERLDVGANKDRVSLVQYGRDAEAHFNLNTYTTKQDVIDRVRGLRHKGGRPLNTGAALQYVRDNVFTPSSGSRRLEGVPQMLILLNGGRSFDNVDTPASALKELGVFVFGIGTKRSDSGELQRISYDPNYAFSVSEFNDLPNVQEQLSSAMSTVVVRATPMTPTVIVEPRRPRRDVVFLLDGSDGTRSGFASMRDFVQRVVERLDVDENKDRVSVVQYSRDPTVQFYLNTYTTKSEVLDTVRGLRHKGGRPLNTGAALQYLRDNVFTASAGSRRLEGVPQLLIVLSGGRSSDSVDTPASELKELGVLTFAIGTRGSDSRELEKISHERSHALSVSDFTDLPTVQEQLQSSMEAVVIDVTPESPTVIVDHDIARKDVVFLLDGSDGTRNGFPAMRDFVQRVVEKFNVGENKDRVSVVQYSRDAEVHFNLNTYTTKQDVLDRVRGLRHKGGRPLNTGAALQYVRDNVFTVSSGSRRQEGIPQILILLSGGRSNDNVDTPASALKEDGVFIVGIGTRDSSAEVQKIATDPSHAQSVSDFSDLPNVQQPFIASLGRVLVGVTTITPTVIVDQKTAGRDVVFLLDGSDGTRSGFPSMIDFVQRVVERLDVGANKDRVSLVQYGRDAEAHFNLNTYTTKQDVIDRVRGLRHKGGRPLNTGAALQYVRDNVFTPSSGSRRLEGVPQMLILLNGGRSFDNVDTPASALKELGVFVFGIGTKRSDSAELQRISYDPNYAFSVSEFNDLPNVQEQLSSAMSTVVVRATPMTPTVIDFLVERRRPRRDVVFLLDGSDGTRSGFASMRDFVQRVVERLDVDENKDRVSVVQYSRDPTVQFYLNTYTTKSEVLDTVRGLRHKGGRPLNTGAALQYLRDNVFTASAGSRRLEGVPQLLIVLSGGRSSDSVDTPASELKELGVLTFAIGTRGSDSRELEKISHERSHALSVSDFTDLPTVQEQLQSSMEAVVIDVTPESPTVIVDQKTAGRDVVFLLDGSDGTRSGFPSMIDFVQRVVERLDVGANKDRVSLVQYGRDAEAHFNLNTYTTKQDVIDRVRGLRHKGGRPLNTGAALQYVRDNVFTPSSGSRRLEGVPQMLILLNGGRSFDNVDTPASALKELGVFVFGIGTKRSDSGELQRISYDPNYAFSVSEFNDLPNVQEQLSSAMSTVVVRATPMTPTVIVEPRRPRRDVVFLLDGSDGTRSGFASMRDFVQRVVERLDVDENKDRVSVVQYSRDPTVQFYLNTYTTKSEVLDTVRGLRHKGGRPLNTGAALQYLRDNVFTASAGSRRLEGVPQLLIVLSGGRSSDSVDTPASELKELGVLTFAIGTRGSDSRELEKISHERSHALSVSDFTDLPTVQEQLQSSMEAVVIDVTPESPTVIVDHDIARKDVVFLLDGSDGTRNGFPAMRDFVQRVVEKFNVGENKDRVSVVQYSRDAEVHFNLNTYTTKQDVLDRVRGLRHRGGRPLNTGAALQYVRDNVFTVSSGSRRQEGIPQILILLSGGRSNDNVDTPASALKEDGVFIVGIGTRDSSAEVQKIATDPSHAQSVSDFSDLPNVQQPFIASLGRVLVGVTTITPTVIVDQKTAGRDVVFLLDGSDGTRSGFPSMIDFVQRVVERLDVGANKDRVSLVQYGRDAEAHFNLNTYTTKQDVIDRVRGLRHKGGRPLNTGAALQYVRDNVFTPSSGSRRLEGVPQMLILLNGGRSFDNVDTPASALKELGVFVFGIGTKRSDSGELQRISYDPNYAFSVSEFNDLPNVQEQLSSAMSTVVVRATPMTPTVIVFIFERYV